ncbi:dipeptidyl peptidase 1-like [Oppia nitens]|uniref:dipeptidyl peptidase 1-like n=1 Tax=Oppia nitens TaxID=1686743 RepID=UPI0023D9CF9C|nr:dipeptidyl peptidase 1-like [Oppia nitens]
MSVLNKLFSSILLVAIIGTGYTVADTPANCTFEDIRGVWLFQESETTSDSREVCNGSQPLINKRKIALMFPNIAVDQYGNKGHWTIIYNQGFEVVITGRKYFAFSDYEQHGTNVTSYCHRTRPGWSHDVLGHNWACYIARRITTDSSSSRETKTYRIQRLIGSEESLFRQNPETIRTINTIQSSWTAKHYHHLEGRPMKEIYRMKGGHKSKILSPPSAAPVTEEIRQMASQLPDSFDWRNINGVSFVSPVRNQGSCGSCYSFSSVGMIEARIRVLTNNTEQLTLSPQDVVSCSTYAQGCEGGFPYLIAGKYGQDYGFIPEECFPYRGVDGQCKEKQCRRYYIASYDYVGGFYGGCNEELMRLSLVKNGPISVSFEVYDDFMSYSSGIYSHTGVSHRSGSNDIMLMDSVVGVRYDPFAITNHAVLAVGYGADPKTGEKYWIVKNSWGNGWGENGYFRIKRGSNECNIESIAVEALPIP